MVAANDYRAMDGDGPIIVVEELRKRYGDVQAVDGVSFQVQKGEVFALLGPNGSGKTTTVEIIEGMRTADSGATPSLQALTSEKTPAPSST